MKKRQLVKLSKKDKERLWSELGPVSQVSFVIKTRIFDDMVYRLILEVRVIINPFTFELVKKHRAHFSKDALLQQLLDKAEYVKEEDAYISYTFSHEYKQGGWDEAMIYWEETQDVLIRMHAFVMQHLDAGIN